MPLCRRGSQTSASPVASKTYSRTPDRVALTIRPTNEPGAFSDGEAIRDPASAQISIYRSSLRWLRRLRCWPDTVLLVLPADPRWRESSHRSSPSIQLFSPGGCVDIRVTLRAMERAWQTSVRVDTSAIEQRVHLTRKPIVWARL